MRHVISIRLAATLLFAASTPAPAADMPVAPRRYVPQVYVAPLPVYAAPVVVYLPPPICRLGREEFYDGYALRWRDIQICD